MHQHPRNAIWRPGMTWDAIEDGPADPSCDERGRLGVPGTPPGHGRHGGGSALLYPPGCRGLPPGARPGRGHLRQGLQQLDCRFLRGGAGPALCRRRVPLQNMDFALEELQRVAKLPCFRGAFLRPMFVEGRLLYPSLLRPAVGGARAPGDDGRRPPDAGPVEPGVDLARPVFRKKSAAGSIKPRSLAVASGPLREERPARRRSLARCRSAIRWRRFCPTGWTITCSSRPR